ncbi:MAG: hypothetical protein ACFFFT_18420 [Candidatus Thorarchaeota archaeon]
MTQTLKEVIVLKSPKIKKHEVQILKIEKEEDQTPNKNEIDNLLGDLKYISNPRYFEEVYTLKQAKQKVYSSNIYGF